MHVADRVAVLLRVGDGRVMASRWSMRQLADVLHLWMAV
jgi:hypothetical protein